MIIRKSLSLNKIHFENPNQVQIYNTLLGTGYSNEHGYGVTDIEFENEIISAFLINRIATFVNEFDFGHRSMQRKPIFIYSEIKFFLDFENNLLYSVGTLKSLNSVKVLLRNTLEKNYSLTNIELSPYKTYKLFLEKEIRFDIEQIIFGKFVYNSGAVGRFSAKITNKEVGFELLEIYKDDIIKISFILKANDAEFKVHFANNNTISLSSDEEELESNLTYLKKIIF